MKRTILYTLITLLTAVACEERHPLLFGELSEVYFNNLNATMSVVDSIDITFVYESSDEMEVPVRLQLVGKVADVDRDVDVVVSSDNAVEGVDYLLPSKACIPAGASYGDYVVTLKRTPALKVEKKELLAYLVDRHGASVTTEQIAAVLWEDRNYDRSLKNQVTSTVASLKKTLQAGDSRELKQWISVHFLILFTQLNSKMTSTRKNLLKTWVNSLYSVPLCLV